MNCIISSDRPATSPGAANVGPLTSLAAEFVPTTDPLA
jgi:hypothetical protein